MKIMSNGVRIHVEQQGTGALALVFLHYWGGSSRTWRHVIDALPERYRTVALDQRGWGASDAPPGGYALADMAGDALAVIAELELERYVLVGHSMGGKVAQLVASRRPRGLAGLVLVAPSPPSPSAVPRAAREAMVGAYGSSESIAATIDHVLTGKTLGIDDRAQVIEDSLRGAAQAKSAWPLHTMVEDITAQVSAIAVPTLVVAGEIDRVEPVEVLRGELMPRIPGARLEILPATGHLSPLESPTELAAAIDNFASALLRYPGAVA